MSDTQPAVEVLLINITVDPNPQAQSGPVFFRGGLQPPQPPQPQMLVYNFFVRADPRFGFNNQAPYGGITFAISIPQSVGYEAGEQQARQQIAEFARDLAQATQGHLPPRP